MSDIQLTNCEDNDLRDCANLIVDEYNNNIMQENWTYESALSFCRYFKMSFPALYLIAKIENEIIGFIIGSVKPWINGYCLIIEELCVKPKHRNQGVASNLLQALIELTQNKYNIVLIKAETYGQPDRMPYIWYIKRGFIQSKNLIIIEQKKNAEG